MEPRLCKTTTAYRRGHSCETTLLALVEKWKNAVDCKKVVGVPSMDMSKAFDSLYHPLLIKKLEAYGLSSKATTLLHSYFSDRYCQVRINNYAESEWVRVNRGCSQGSNLGPVLWNFYQNDLPLNINKSELMMYAYDYELYVIGNDIVEIQTTLTDEGKLTSQTNYRVILKNIRPCALDQKMIWN